MGKDRDPGRTRGCGRGRREPGRLEGTQAPLGRKLLAGARNVRSRSVLLGIASFLAALDGGDSAGWRRAGGGGPRRDSPPIPTRPPSRSAATTRKRSIRKGGSSSTRGARSVYADGHIPGARDFPVWESDIDARVKAFFDEGLDQNAPIVIYCSGGDCEDSHMLAEKLYMVGFNALFIYKDGFPGWTKRGLPVNKGANP